MKVQDPSGKKSVHSLAQAAANEKTKLKKESSSQTRKTEEALRMSRVFEAIERARTELTEEINRVRADKVAEAKAKVEQGNLPESAKVAEKIAEFLK